MRKRESFRLIRSTCRRCGCEVWTGSRSLFGLDAVKAEHDRVCDRCTTPAERQRIEAHLRAAVIR